MYRAEVYKLQHSTALQMLTPTFGLHVSNYWEIRIKDDSVLSFSPYPKGKVILLFEMEQTTNEKC